MGIRTGDARILFTWEQSTSKNNGSWDTRPFRAAEETRSPFPQSPQHCSSHFRSNHSDGHSCCYFSAAFAATLKSRCPSFWPAPDYATKLTTSRITLFIPEVWTVALSPEDWSLNVSTSTCNEPERCYIRFMRTVRGVKLEDADAIWRILEPMLRAGETYPLPREMNKDEALSYWMGTDHEVFVAEEDSEIVGTYFLKANQKGGGAHVANCGYVTAAAAQGRGLARMMCHHSIERAKERAFRAMQFNFV